MSAKDGQKPITNQTMPPAANDEPEWIALSAEQSIVPDQTATQRAVPIFSPPKLPSQRKKPEPARWPIAVAVVGLLAGVAWWSLTRNTPMEDVALVIDAGALVSVMPVV